MNDTEKLLASYDCGNAGGWLSEDLECAIDSEPWCQRHELLDLQRRVKLVLTSLEAWSKELAKEIAGDN
jgi:hypothetical protein